MLLLSSASDAILLIGRNSLNRAGKPIGQGPVLNHVYNVIHALTITTCKIPLEYFNQIEMGVFSKVISHNILKFK